MSARCVDSTLRVISFSLILVLATIAPSQCEVTTDPPTNENGAAILHTLQGKVYIESDTDEWVTNTKVVVDGGRFYGFLKQNGDFEIHNVPSGSYLVEVSSPDHWLEPARVDISSKTGKVRARKVNLLKPSDVSYLPYPLKFTAEQRAEFFEKREKWNILDTLKNPMVLLLVGPVVLMMLLPRLMKSMNVDQKEVQEQMTSLQQPASSMPSMEEMLTNWFGGGGKTTPTSSSGSSTATKKIKGAGKKPKH